MTARGDGSRLDRALGILRVDENAPAGLLADVLWLAQALPLQVKTTVESGPAIPVEEEPKPVLKDKAVEPEAPKKDDPVVSGKKEDEKSRIYAPQPGTLDGAFIPATFISVPAADSLPNRLQIDRALRPFLKRFPSRRLKQLDAERTAEASADRRAISPVFRPLPERWFDVLLLVERTDAMEVWTDTIRELQSLLGRHGAFRNVRVLRYAVMGKSVSLFTTAGQPLSARTAADPDGRRLCLFITNGTSKEWKRSVLIEFVMALGRRTVAAIVQMLPQRAWGHTELGDALERLHSITPASANAMLQIEDSLTGLSQRVDDARCVPALTLEPKAMARWARFVMSPRKVISPAILLETAEVEGTEQAGAGGMAAERLASFRETASAESFQLLRVLAGAPLTLPIMRLVQQAVSESREQFHLAEVMLSGVIERVTAANSGVPVDQVFYDFVPGVRELLIATLSSGETGALDQAMRPVQDRLRSYVESETGKVRDFRALLADPQGVEKLPASARSFVEVSRRIYEGRGILPARKEALGMVGTSEIQPVVLAIDRPIESAVISGLGRYVAATGERVQIWDLQMGTSHLCVGHGQLVAPSGTDQIFLESEGTVALLDSSPMQFETLSLAQPGGLPSVSPDGRRWDYSMPFRIAHWDRLTPAAWDTNTSSSQPTSTASSLRTVLLGFAEGGIASWQIENGHEVKTNLPGSIKKVAVSSSGDCALAIVGSGAVFLVTIGSEMQVQPLPVSNATAVAMTGDGVFAITGHEDGLVKVWDLKSLVAVAELRQGTQAVLRVAVTSSGDKAVSASNDGLKLWDLSGLMKTQRPPVQRKALVPRRIKLIGDSEFSEKVASSLRDAGHKLIGDLERIDYTVDASKNWVRNPYLPNPLRIRTLEELPQLLDELDRNPPGVLSRFPPMLQDPISRPSTEKALAEFVAGLKGGQQAFIQSRELDGATVTLMTVLASDTLRRVFSQGIYWNIGPPAQETFGKIALVIYTNAPFLRHDLPLFCASLALFNRSESPASLLKFDFPALDKEDADNHLRAAGMNEEQIAAAVKFHHGSPLLVSLVAGAFRRKIEIWGTYVETTKGLFDRGAATLLASLQKDELTAVIRLSARFSDDPLNTVPPATLAFARECGWLLMSGNSPTLIGRACDRIAELYPTEYAEAHESVCLEFEQLSEQDNNHLNFLPGMEHALLAGGVPRVERYLRHPRILSECIGRSIGGFFAERITPWGKESQFLDRLSREIRAGLWNSTTMEHIHRFVAPPPQWPDSSGVVKARASGYSGKDIRVMVPGSGCNPNHPEMLGREFSSTSVSDASGYGTAICSVIAGSYIGVAPGVVIDPLIAIDHNSATTIQELSDKLAVYLEHPPDILCLTLFFAVDYKMTDPLRSVIQGLVKKDVLVIAAMGNDEASKYSVPGIYPEVLSVGTCDFQGEAPEYSKRGSFLAFESPRTFPDVRGYGVDVTAAEGKDGYRAGSGTSYACAYVAGIAALYGEAMQLRGEELRKQLIRTADPETRAARFIMSSGK